MKDLGCANRVITLNDRIVSRLHSVRFRKLTSVNTSLAPLWNINLELDANLSKDVANSPENIERQRMSQVYVYYEISTHVMKNER